MQARCRKAFAAPSQAVVGGKGLAATQPLTIPPDLATICELGTVLPSKDSDFTKLLLSQAHWIFLTED